MSKIKRGAKRLQLSSCPPLSPSLRALALSLFNMPLRVDTVIVAVCITRTQAHRRVFSFSFVYLHPNHATHQDLFCTTLCVCVHHGIMGLLASCMQHECTACGAWPILYEISRGGIIAVRASVRGLLFLKVTTCARLHSVISKDWNRSLWALYRKGSILQEIIW